MAQLQQRERSLHYYDPCNGIAPMVIRSPRDFLAAQALVLALALIVLLLAV